jgi:hypothetical protein
VLSSGVILKVAPAERSLRERASMLGFLVLTLGACTAQVGREAAGQGGAGPGSGGSGAAATGGRGNPQSVGGASGSAGASTGGGG